MEIECPGDMGIPRPVGDLDEERYSGNIQANYPGAAVVYSSTHIDDYHLCYYFFTNSKIINH